MKKVLLFLLAGVTFLSVQAQNMDMARKMYYYERYKSAKTEFEKLVAANGGNADAHYWLTLTNLMMGKKADARVAAQAGLTATNSNPLLLVAMGHVELSEGKKEDARSRFETAISLADKKTQAGILNAVGRAHGTVLMKNSDPVYGIEKLKLAAQKDPKNADIYINLGDCYRRQLDGGNAILSYEQALTLDPANARAPYKCGLVYKTQDNCDALKRNFNRATAIDGNFMPAWRELYESYAKAESNCFNLAEARTYFDKYTQTTDQGLETDMLKMSFCYYSKDFTCALNEANAMAPKYGKDAEVEVLKWKAFIYNQMGDSLNAAKSLDEYFVKETNTDNIDLSLYLMQGSLYAKMPGQEAKAIDGYQKYLALEPNKAKQVRVMTACAGLCEKMKDLRQAAGWYEKIIATKETPGAYDYFMAGYTNFNLADYEKSAGLFKTYSEKFPADWRGPYWTGRNYAVIDSTMELGTAVPFYETFLPLGEAAPDAKASVISVYRYLFIYQLQMKKDRAAATALLGKLKAADSTNASIPEFERYLGIRPAAPPPPAPAPKPAVRPATGTTPKTPAGGTKPAPGAKKPAAVKPVAKTVKKKPNPDMMG